MHACYWRAGAGQNEANGIENAVYIPPPLKTRSVPVHAGMKGRGSTPPSSQNEQRKCFPALPIVRHTTPTYYRAGLHIYS